MNGYGTVTVYGEDSPENKAKTEEALRAAGHSWACVRKDGRLEWRIPVAVNMASGTVRPA
jgi:hypothetical protein